jgi:hypothetical protein
MRARTVTLGQSNVDRLSRMDAMQGQFDGARDDAAKGAFVKYRICPGSDAGTLHSLR